MLLLRSQSVVWFEQYCANTEVNKVVSTSYQMVSREIPLVLLNIVLIFMMLECSTIIIVKSFFKMFDKLRAVYSDMQVPEHQSTGSNKQDSHWSTFASFGIS